MWRERMFEKVKGLIAEHKARIMLATISLLGLVASVSAADFDEVKTMIDEIVLIMPYIVDMVIAAIPIIVVIALAAFIVGFLDSIIRKLK
jgi:hypothetical protein